MDIIIINIQNYVTDGAGVLNFHFPALKCWRCPRVHAEA